ncbi:MAG: hypothetical protein K2N63_05130 [Lachnospiraceae bacterium]|nr:hypothetical protein [Lachnospiraceae bacterium]
MLQEWLTNGVFLYLMAGVCGAGAVLKVLLSAYYNRQLHWTQKMDKARKKWLVRMRQDYEDCMDENGRVNNVDIFVDKYIEGKKFMGILLSTWDKIGGQAWILCAGLLAVSAVSSVFYQVEREAVLFTFFIGTWTVIVDIVVDNIANLGEKKKQIKRNLVDYFENRMGLPEDDMLPEEEIFEEASYMNDFGEDGEDTVLDDVSFSRDGKTGANAYTASAKSSQNRLEGASQQSAALEEESFGQDMGRSGKAAPKFYVAGRRAGQEMEEEGGKNSRANNMGGKTEEQSDKKMRRESKKDMMARKKREHMKYELKREISQDTGRDEEIAGSQEAALDSEALGQGAQKTPSREAVEQLAAALEMLKRENALDEAAPLLAAQIGKDQENGALIEEVLREFLV